jgi:CRP-like cAMP-binding protein
MEAMTSLDYEAHNHDDDRPTPFLEALDDEAREALMRAGERRAFDRGEQLMRAGERGDHVMVILSGSVAAISPASEGSPVVLAVRGPGDLIGELAALDSRPRSATVNGLTPGEALVIPGDSFDAFLDATPSAARAALAMIAQRLREADAQRASGNAPEEWRAPSE